MPYKRVDLAVRAFTKLGRRLIVAGDGPELSRLRALAGPTVELRGSISQEALPALFARARCFVLPGEEDFGIAPVEAQAAGRPVLALGRGGALETVIDGETGAFFEEPEIDSLIAGLERLDALEPSLDPARIRQHAQRFAAARFGPELQAVLARLLAK